MSQTDDGLLGGRFVGQLEESSDLVRFERPRREKLLQVVLYLFA